MCYSRVHSYLTARARDWDFLFHVINCSRDSTLICGFRIACMKTNLLVGVSFVLLCLQGGGGWGRWVKKGGEGREKFVRV